MRTHAALQLFLVLGCPLAAQVPGSYSYQVQLTGRLLGYARVPDQQTLAPQSGPLQPNAVAKRFNEQFDAASSGAALLRLRVGMGDNFAPDLFSRTVDTAGVPLHPCPGAAPYPSTVHLPKDFLTYHPATHDRGDNEPGYWSLWCDNRALSTGAFFDNVAQFFIYARYDALVPGKHDFYFGPQYLRYVAAFLRQHGVHMLADNLIMTTSVSPGTMNVHPRIPQRAQTACHDNSSRHDCFHTDFGPASLDLPDNVLPWKQQFVLRSARRAFIHVPGQRGTVLFRDDELSSYKAASADYDPLFNESSTAVCVEPGPSTASDPAMVMVPNRRCAPLVPSDLACAANMAPHLASTCRNLYPDTGGIYKPETYAATTNVTFLFQNAGDHLIPGLNHMFCTYPAKDYSPSKDPAVPICQTFPVQVPLFWPAPDQRSSPAAPGCDSSSNAPCPYLLVKRDGEAVAVFAVVDPDLLSNVGMLNTSWLNAMEKWDTQTQVTAPDYALLQTLELCNAIDACREAPKILLAQMSYARASQLIATGAFSNTFDLVIAQASAEHDPGTFTATSFGKSPRFVLAPPVPVSGGGADFTPQVYAASITRKTMDDAVSWTVTNGLVKPPEKLPVRPPANFCRAEQRDCRNLERISVDWLEAQHSAGTIQAFPVTAPGAANAFTQAVLLSMRKRLKTDIAMLQARDFYDANFLSYQQTTPALVQDQINRILWKDDFAVVLHVNGATIRSLLKQSALFSQQEQNALTTEIERGRALITLGISPDPKDPNIFYVNGAVMNDQALYTVATTDFIAGGDTGYANLASPDVPPPFRLRDFANPRVRSIAGVVCSDIIPYFSSPKDDNLQAQCMDIGLLPDYFDESTARPFDGTPGFSTSQHWRGFFRNFFMPRRPFLDSEERVQQRPFWMLSLENLDFSETGVFINHIARTTAALGGISNPLLANKGSNNFGADHRARFVYDFKRGTLYVLSDSSFLLNATTSGPPSLANNILGTEAGGTLRLPLKRSGVGLKTGPDRWERPSWLSLQYSLRYEHELVAPIGSSTTLASGTTVPLPAPKISTLYGRAGMRADLGDTYLEMGMEEIDSRGLLQNYVLSPSSGPAVLCQPGAAAALACANDGLSTKPFTVVMHTTDYKTPGAYLNFYWKFPIWSRQDANRADQSWYITLTNKGDLYFNTSADTPVQTRYLDKLTPALNFPIWGNISLTPKLDFILYENKVNRYHYRAIQPAFSVSYTFTRREGMAWTRALAYGAQTTKASPAGSTH